MLFRAGAWSTDDTSPAWRANAACRFDALLPGRSGHDSILQGRPGAWKRRPQVRPALPSIQEQPREPCDAAALLAVSHRVQGIIHKPGPQSLAFSPKASAPLDEDEVRSAMRPKFAVPTPPPRPAPPRSGQHQSRWGSGRALYVDLVQAINGTAVADLLAATTAAEADGGSKWPEYGLARERLQALQQLKVALSAAVESTDVSGLSEVLAAARSLRVHQDAPMVGADSWPQYIFAEQRYERLLSLKSELREVSMSSSLNALVVAKQMAEDVGVGSWPEALIAQTRLECLQRLCGQLFTAVASCQRPPLEAALQEAQAFRVTGSAEAPLGPAVALAASRLQGLQRAELLRQLAAGSDLSALRQTVLEAELEVWSSFLWQEELPEARQRLAALSIIELQLLAARLSSDVQHIRAALASAHAATCTDWTLFTEVTSQLDELEAGADGSQDAETKDSSVSLVAVVGIAFRHGGEKVTQWSTMIRRQLAEQVTRLCGLQARVVRELAMVYDSPRSQEEQATYVELALVATSPEEFQKGLQVVKGALKDAASSSGSQSDGFLQLSHHLWDSSVAGRSAEMLEHLAALEHAAAAPTLDEEMQSVDMEQIVSETRSQHSVASSADLAEEACSLMQHLIGYACSAAQSSSSEGAEAESVQPLSSSAAMSESRHSIASAVDTDSESGQLTPLCRSLVERLYQGSSRPSSSVRTVQLTGSCAQSSYNGRGSRLSQAVSSMSASNQGSTPQFESAALVHPAGSSEASSLTAEDLVVKLMMQAMPQHSMPPNNSQPVAEDETLEQISMTDPRRFSSPSPAVHEQEAAEAEGCATPCSAEVADVLQKADAEEQALSLGRKLDQERALISASPVEGLSDARTTPVSFLLLEGLSEARTTPLSFLLLQSSSADTGSQAAATARTAAEEARMLAPSRATVYSGEGDEAADVAAAMIQSSLPEDSSVHS